MGYAAELKKANLKTRNRLRSILTLESEKAVAALNSIRRSASAGELAQVDRILRASPGSTKTPLVPELFPISPQTKEDYNRLEPVSLDVQLGLIAHHVRDNEGKVRLMLAKIFELNRSIVAQSFDLASAQLTDFVSFFGHSHFALRKAALLRVLSNESAVQDAVDDVLIKAGLKENNLLASSLVHCYQEEPAFLSMKRSIMSLRDRGGANKFTRDISRIPFHPHSNNLDELRDHIQSSMQFSLLDALITAKLKRQFVSTQSFPVLHDLFDCIERSAPSLDEIAKLQHQADNGSEMVFYKRSSAWLESAEIARYRLLIDHFYDTPDAAYINITEELVADVASWICVDNLDGLATCIALTKHSSPHLRELENAGCTTRSALFNYCLHATQGFTTVTESNLVRLMGITQELSKTISSSFAANLAKSVRSDTSKLILYLLIAKRSRNERDDHLLRRIVQTVTIKQFNRNLVALLTYLEKQSSDIAVYAYEVFTEDFIAKLYHLIENTSGITETRAEIHRWMGQHTGDKAYHDRARTLLIDHQLNKVRNEIDDNRIYVDVARFQEWINEEVLRDLTSALTSLEHKGFEAGAADTILAVLMERCYSAFCSDKAFGIASYLGRRIRHGTFKGHLYAGVVALEREPRFQPLWTDAHARHFWEDWKAKYESKIDEIIRERLHVASQAKRDGLLKPGSVSARKTEIIAACINDLVKDYVEHKTVATSIFIITEYCWRLAEVDLQAFNPHLKGQRRNFSDGLSGISAECYNSLRELASDFHRSIDRSIGERQMTMTNWFARPSNVSPKASLSLLFRAVVEEVRGTFPELKSALDCDPKDDVDLFGGVYHVLYDSFYVLVYNAAKHGKSGGDVIPKFAIVRDPNSGKQVVVVEITSELNAGDDEVTVMKRLDICPEADIENAQTYENRSGIPKLLHLQKADKNFSFQGFKCENRVLSVSLNYRLDN